MVFLEYLCILRKEKKNPNKPKRSNGDNCAFCVS